MVIIPSITWFPEVHALILIQFCVQKKNIASIVSSVPSWRRSTPRKKESIRYSLHSYEYSTHTSVQRSASPSVFECVYLCVGGGPTYLSSLFISFHSLRFIVILIVEGIRSN